MKIGISTATFFNKVTTEHSFDVIKRCGVDLCELFLTTYYEYTPQFADVLLSNKNDVEVHSVHTLNSQFEPQLFNSAPRTRQDADRIFCACLDTAQKMGAKYYTFHGMARLKRFKEYTINYESLAAMLNRITAMCGEYGITLSYENVHWALYNFTDFFRKIKSLVPSLAATLDIKQAFQSHCDYREYIKDMGSSISTVHVCDYDADGKLCAIGKGCFDFKELIARLRDSGANPPIIVELYSGDYSNISEVKDSVDYLRSLLQ